GRERLAGCGPAAGGGGAGHALARRRGGPRHRGRGPRGAGAAAAALGRAVPAAGRVGRARRILTRGPGGAHTLGLSHAKNMRRYWLVFSQAVTVLLAAYFVVMTMKPEWLRTRPTTTGLSTGVALTEAPTAANAPPPPGSFRVAAQKASQAVVSINTSQAADRPSSSDPWLRFFFGEQGSVRQSGLGSGVLISPAGYIL